VCPRRRRGSARGAPGAHIIREPNRHPGLGIVPARRAARTGRLCSWGRKRRAKEILKGAGRGAGARSAGVARRTGQARSWDLACCPFRDRRTRPPDQRRRHSLTWGRAVTPLRSEKLDSSERREVTRERHRVSAAGERIRDYSSPISARISRSSAISGSSLGRMRSKRSTVSRSSARASPYRPSWR
jgi:hypothetical protein